MPQAAEKKKTAAAVQDSTRNMKLQARERDTKILQKDFLQASFAYNRWSVTLPFGISFKETLVPEFWANVAHLLAPNKTTGQPARVGDVIEVRTIDGSMYGELYVRAVRTESLIVSVIKEPVYFNVDKMNPTAPNSMKVRFNVGKRKYEVTRKSDGVVVGDGFDLKENAVDFIEKMAG